jgi:hypothetical protein
MNACAVRQVAAVVIAASFLTPRSAAAQSTRLPDILRDVGQYVESYFTRVQSIVGTETVRVQPLAHDFSADGRMRTLVYELRLDWAAGLAGQLSAQVVRELVKVDGRVPRPRDEPRCLDPHAITPEPLEFLRPGNQEKFIFTLSGSAVVDGRRAHLMDYRGRTPEPVDVTWKDDCATIDLPGRTRGRVWVDATDATILRLDEGLVGQVDVRVPVTQQRRGAARAMVLERADTSIKYKPVRFADPEETLFLPDSVDVLQVIRDAGTPRLRVTHRFSNYRRFVTGGRLVN